MQTVFFGQFKQATCFYIGMATGEAFRFDEGTANLTEEEMILHWGEIEAADREELEQFVRENV